MQTTFFKIFLTQIAVSYHDLVPLPEEEIQNSEVVIRPFVWTSAGERQLPEKRIHLDKNGISELLINTPENAERMSIQVRNATVIITVESNGLIGKIKTIKPD